MTKGREPIGKIRIGIGGWSYMPWRETFYPKEVPRSRELEYASRQVTAIEVNATFYRTQTAATFARWRDEAPPHFVFSLKAPRYATHRRMLAGAGAVVERFVTSGPSELGQKLGPILWSFPPAQRFELQEFEAFLKLLPTAFGRLRLRHVLDVRHESFMCAEFVQLARRHRVAIAYADTGDYPSCADITADFVYARLKRSVSSLETGYSSEALDAWAERARAWARGEAPADLPYVERPGVKSKPREVFVFFIAGAKERAPAAARALLARIG